MPLALVRIAPERKIKMFGETMRGARMRAGLTVIEVAVKAGVAQKVVERIEAGENVTLLGWLAVAQVLGVYVEVG